MKLKQTNCLNRWQEYAIATDMDANSRTHDAATHRKQAFAFTCQRWFKMIGAVQGNITWDWCYIDTLWVAPGHRDQNLGTALMQQIEQHASAHDCAGIWLWTQNWQAPAFYESLGFAEFARFDDFPRGHSRIGYRKYL